MPNASRRGHRLNSCPAPTLYQTQYIGATVVKEHLGSYMSSKICKYQQFSEDSITRSSNKNLKFQLTKLPQAPTSPIFPIDCATLIPLESCQEKYVVCYFKIVSLLQDFLYTYITCHAHHWKVIDWKQIFQKLCHTLTSFSYFQS